MCPCAAGVSTFETLAHGREEVKRASIREHSVKWSSLTLMRFTKDFWTVNDVTKHPWILWPHLTPLPSPREGSLTSCLQICFDNAWCLNLCKVKCISNYTLYYSNHFAHRLPMQKAKSWLRHHRPVRTHLFRTAIHKQWVERAQRYTHRNTRVFRQREMPLLPTCIRQERWHHCTQGRNGDCL